VQHGAVTEKDLQSYLGFGVAAIMLVSAVHHLMTIRHHHDELEKALDDVKKAAATGTIARSVEVTPLLPTTAVSLNLPTAALLARSPATRAR
jgi:hypothetical protein